MNTKMRRFAPLGLYLSLLAALISAGLFIVQRAWNLPLQISLGLVIIGLALFAILDPEKVRTALTGRQARYGSNALVMSLAFVGILAVVNFLVYKNTQRWDLTEDKQYTLTPETISTLDSLKQPVKAQAFFTQRISSDQAKGLLEQYQFNSHGKFTFEFIDPVSNPVAAEQAKVTQDGTIVLHMGDHQELVTSATEQDLTSGLVRLMNPQESTVYFLTGHGEYNPEDTGDQSYSQVKSTLESKNYTVKTLNLLATNKIPEDAKLIVIAGPRKPVSEDEVKLLSNYVDTGGSMIVMEEPLPVTDFGDASDPLADYLSKSWGITLGKDIVIDQTSNQPFAPYAAQYGSSPITQKIQRTTSQFPTVRSVQLDKSITGISQVELVKTAPQSWAETNLSDLQNQNAQITFDQSKDVAGPITLAISAENLTNKGRIVVFGDSDFANDGSYSAYANGDLFVNSVDWAAKQENLINLTPKNSTQRLMVPPQQITMNLILLGSVFLLPGLVLLSGATVWFERRKRG